MATLFDWMGYSAIKPVNTAPLLQEQVRQKIKDGYQPLGGVSSAAFGISPVGRNKYIQAVVRYKES